MAAAVLHRPRYSNYAAPEEIKTWKERDRRLRPLEESGIGDLTSGRVRKLRYVLDAGVLAVSDASGTVTARIENNVLICEMEE